MENFLLLFLMTFESSTNWSFRISNVLSSKHVRFVGVKQASHCGGIEHPS